MEVTEQILNAKLEATEARTESKFAQFMGELKVISATLTTLVDDVKSLKGDMRDVKADVGTLKTDVAVIKSELSHKPSKGFIVTVMTIIGGLAVAGTTVLSRLGLLTHTP